MASSTMTLYWSNLELYEKCPQKFLWSRGWEDMDVGGGPGKGKPSPVKDSKHHALMGIVIQKVIEDFYNEELWKHPVKLLESLMERVDRAFDHEVSRMYIDWGRSPTRDELLKTCRDGVAGYMRTMKANRLLGPYSRAEVDLIGWIDKWNPVAGRADLIVRRDDTGTSILDGKNSQEKGKYTDPDQLRWYALCHYLAYGKMPDRLGFVYYRYPFDEASGETGVTWVPCTRDDIKGIAIRAVEARKKMRRRKFEANPSPTGCKYCVYETVCDARLEQKAYNSRNRKKPGVEDIGLSSGGGVVDLDLSSFGSGKKTG